MKKTLQRLGIVTVGLSLCLWSCKEQDGLVKPSEAPASITPKIKDKIDFSVVEGRLKFETMEDFEAAFGKAATEQGRKEFEFAVGFKSFNEVYEEFLSKKLNGEISQDYESVVRVVKDDEGRMSYDRTFSINSMTALVNKIGLVQIGDKVLKFSEKFVKIANVKYISELESDEVTPNIIVNEIVSKYVTETNKSARVKDWYWEVYNWWHYPRPSWAADRRLEARIYTYLFNTGETYLWEFGTTIQNQRDDFWGWSASTLEGWSNGNGYATIVPNGFGSEVTQSQIIPLSPMSWTANSYAGTANYRRIVNGKAYPTRKQPFLKLGMNVKFRPGSIIAREFSTDNYINYLSFDQSL